VSAASYAASRRKPISRIAARIDSRSTESHDDCDSRGIRQRETARIARCHHPASNERREENKMSIGTILLIILVLLLIGAVPAWPYSREWGYFPSGIVGVLVVVLVVMVLMGRL
jgi:hypothetical protein